MIFPTRYTVTAVIIIVGELQGFLCARTFFESIHCEVVDKQFGYFKECSIKNLKNEISLNVCFSLRPKNVKNIMIRLVLYRKDNKYRPYLYNDTIDFCDFMKTSKRHIFWNFIFSLIGKYSNINHSCPYSDDVMVKGFNFGKQRLKGVPLPNGRYMTAMTISIKNDIKAVFKIFAQRK